MALFRAAIYVDLISLMRFPFPIHLQSFSGGISQVCRLKYLCRCFSSNFSFLVFVDLFILMLPVLLLAAIIYLSLFFNVIFASSYWSVYAIPNADESSSFFFS